MSPSEVAGGEKRRESVASVRALLHRRIRITLQDGRLVEGVLECFDAIGNLVLRDSVDITNIGGKSSRHPRGLVLVPGDSYTFVHAEKETLLPRRQPGLQLDGLSIDEDHARLVADRPVL